MRRRKIVKKGFQLCLMVCGHSGTGKSTFINTLCDGQVYPATNGSPRKTNEMDIRTHHVDLGEPDGTTIGLTVVDTPGFGDSINNNDCCSRILKYIEHQFDEILAEETRVNRNPRFCDNRVHLALYFITPTGRGLRELDIDFMMALCRRVNIIPVIAKSDTLTAGELSRTKKAVMADIEYFKIPIYYFPYEVNGNQVDEETVDECISLRELVPFAIVGSNSTYPDPDDSGLPVRGRKYPWGFVKIEDPDHSDFSALKSVIFGSHIQELRDLTHDVIYEKYRTEKLSETAQTASNTVNNPNPTVVEDCEQPTEGNVNNINSHEDHIAERGRYPHSVSGPPSRNPLYLEQQKLKELEESFKRDVEQKRQELFLRQSQLKDIEAQLGQPTNESYYHNQPRE